MKLPGKWGTSAWPRCTAARPACRAAAGPPRRPPPPADTSASAAAQAPVNIQRYTVTALNLF